LAAAFKSDSRIAANLDTIEMFWGAVLVGVVFVGSPACGCGTLEFEFKQHVDV
jgi:hypothetical protein